MRERKRFARFLLLCIFGCIALVCGGIWTTHLKMLRWETVVVRATGAIDAQEVTHFFDTLHTSTYFGIVPKDTILYIPRTALREELMAHFLRVYDVRIVREGAVLLVALTERTPSALWCGDVVPTQETAQEASGIHTSGYGTCYVADAEGFLYLKEEELDSASRASLPHYYSSLSKAEPLGQYFVPTKDFLQLQKLYQTFQQTGQHTLWAILVDDERDIELYLSSHMRILASRSDTPENILKRTNALYSAGVLSDTATSTYIDMRFGDKVYIGQ